jgi:hypothetical protein
MQLMPKHVHHWRSSWVLAMGIHDTAGWMPVLFYLHCPCGHAGLWYGEESSVLQQRRVHAGERDV